MDERPLLLFVEDDELLARAYLAFLDPLPCEILHLTTGREALEQLERRAPDILLLDLLLPDIHGQQVLDRIRELSLPVASVVVTTEASANAAVKALQAGASDYLVKPLDADRLLTTLRNMLERVELKRRLTAYEASLPGDRFEGFVGGSPAMRAVYRIIESAAASNAGVFITGESGTGKELCAEAVHRRSARGPGPFVAVNCAAIPRDLMESELFGHVRGAFTGATRDRQGAAARADGGTLFFDEICEMDLDIQAKLLRFVQTRRFLPVGGSREQATDVRFICATNKDPLEEVRAGRFREDLYYRLYVVPIELPPLRRRGRDLLLLARHFLDRFGEEEGKRFEGFTPEAERRLLDYPWPGNVRQLENVIRNLVVMTPGGKVQAESLRLSPADRPVETAPTPADSSVLAVNPASPHGEDIIRPLWETERDAIEQAIEQCGGNVVEAARRLGISDSTIYRKRKRWEAGGE